MRLIDADALIDWIRNDSGDKLMDSLYIDHINEMPTSYDVEKVVDQLQNMSNSIPLQYECNYKQGISDGIDKAIEVVKKGYDGTDDVCEWREDGYRRWHTQCNALADNSPLEYKYCPYCGKKIRMTENIGTWQKAIMSKGKMIGADGIDFIPIMWDGREESIFRSYTLEELKHPQPLPKSDRRYWKMKDGKKVYIKK